MNTHSYNKKPWRERNLKFLKAVYPQGLSGSYIELLGGISDEFGAKSEMYYLMKSSGMIKEPSQFIGVDLDPVVLLKRIEKYKKDHPYPVIFGDINDSIGRVFAANNNLTIINPHNNEEQLKIKVNSNLQVFNFDTESAIKDIEADGSKNWWANNKEYLKSFVKKSIQKNGKCALILNFTRDRGGDRPDSEGISGPEFRVNLLVKNAKECFGQYKQFNNVTDSVVDQNRTEGRRVYMATIRLMFTVTSNGVFMKFWDNDSGQFF
jgi:predicted ester cyclase